MFTYVSTILAKALIYSHIIYLNILQLFQIYKKG